MISGRLPKYAPHNALMSMQYFVMLLPLPLWIVTRTSAPRWSVGALVLLNTLIVITCQVRVGRNVTTIRDGGSALRRAGLMFLVSCCAIGFAAGLPGSDRLLAVSLDVTDSAFIDPAVQAALERFGWIDVLLNSADYGRPVNGLGRRPGRLPSPLSRERAGPAARYVTNPGREWGRGRR